MSTIIRISPGADITSLRWRPAVVPTGGHRTRPDRKTPPARVANCASDWQQNSSGDRSAGTAALSDRFRLHRISGDHKSPAHVWMIAVMLTAVSLVSLVVAANIAERSSWTHNIAYLCGPAEVSGDCPAKATERIVTEGFRIAGRYSEFVLFCSLIAVRLSPMVCCWASVGSVPVSLHARRQCECVGIAAQPEDG